MLQIESPYCLPNTIGGCLNGLLTRSRYANKNIIAYKILMKKEHQADYVRFAQQALA